MTAQGGSGLPGAVAPVVQVASAVESQLYHGGDGNGRRTRRVATITALLVFYVLWSWWNNERVLTALDGATKRLDRVSAEQDTIRAQVKVTTDWIKYHQQWSERAVRDANEVSWRLWRAVGRPEEYVPIE